MKIAGNSMLYEKFEISRNSEYLMKAYFKALNATFKCPKKRLSPLF